MKTKNEDIIKKLFESKCSLSPEERAALNNYEYVNDTFHRQWEEMSEEAVDLVREEKILNGIMKKVRGRRFPFIKKSFYKYGMAAMIAVCMVLSALLLMKNSGEEIIYVVNTGYQSMDSVRLADGTKVMLNAGSRLTYPKEFSGEKREVQLPTDMCAIFQRVSLGLMWNMILNRSTLLSEEKEISLQIFAKK